MNRPVYFGAGPARIPQEVLQEAAQAVLSYEDSGLSILELPHRGKHFTSILEESDSLVRSICGIGDDYEVLWLQGGGRLQFAMVPANFLKPGATAAYIDSGHWAKDALETARLYGNVSVPSSSKELNYSALPEWPRQLSDEPAYIHLTTNNTIYGTQWRDIPESNFPLIADMSSDIFGVPRNYNQFALFYAVAQKNLGPAGVTLVVVKKTFLENARTGLPPYLSYKAHAAAHSVLNTAPVAAIHVCLLMLRHLSRKGLQEQLAENAEKARLLYEAIASSPHFTLSVAEESRSMMNAVFRTSDPASEGAFIQHCAANNILGIEGHRSAGGFRASLYNAVSLRDVRHLTEAIQTFNPIPNT